MGTKRNCNTKFYFSILFALVICGGFLPLIWQNSKEFSSIAAYKENYEENDTWGQVALHEKDDSTYTVSFAGELDDPISVYSNDDLNDLKIQGIITGEGTEGNPYVLEDLVIDTDFSGSAIYIWNTDAYLIIKNCTVLNSGILNDEDAGISIRGCSNINIMNCLLDNNERAIGLYDNSFNNIVINNTILHSNDFALNIGGHDNEILNNILTDNDCYAIDLWEAENNVITGNIIINNHGGIQFSGYSHYNIIFENEISLSTEKGIKLYLSNGNNITRNNIHSNHDEIHLYSSDENVIYFNDIYGNSYIQAFEDEGCTDNQWDNGIIGNYWGNDYTTKYPDATNDGTIWDTPYEIYGAGLGIDHFPLVNSIFYDIEAPQFTDVPEDFSVDEGYSGLNISWIATDLHPATYTIELDGTKVVSATTWIRRTEILYDIPYGLLGGDYNITIIISDENGNTAQDTVIFTVNNGKIHGYNILTFSLVFSCTASIIIVSIRKRRNSRITLMRTTL